MPHSNFALFSEIRVGIVTLKIRPSQPTVSKTDQPQAVIVGIIVMSDSQAGGSMLGYGLAGTVLVILLIVFLVRGNL